MQLQLGCNNIGGVHVRTREVSTPKPCGPMWMSTFWNVLLINIDHRSYKGAKTFGYGQLPHNVSNTKAGAKNSSTNSRSSYSRQWQGKTCALREAVSLWQLGFSQVDELQFRSTGTVSYFKWYLSRSTIPTAWTHIPYQQHANVTRPSPTRAWTHDFKPLKT